GAQQSDAQRPQFRQPDGPGFDGDEAAGEKVEVEVQPPGQLVLRFFVFAQEIDQQRRQIVTIERVGDKAVVRAESAAAAAVRKHDQACRAGRYGQVAVQQARCELDANRTNGS